MVYGGPRDYIIENPNPEVFSDAEHLALGLMSSDRIMRLKPRLKNKYDNYCKIILDTTNNTKFQIPDTPHKDIIYIYIYIDISASSSTLICLKKTTPNSTHLKKTSNQQTRTLVKRSTGGNLPRHLTGNTWKRSRTITSSGGSDWLSLLFELWDPRRSFRGHD